MYPNFSGQNFGQYQILDPIGRGGMAVVYRAKELNLDRYVALKIIATHLAGQSDFIARFKREAGLIAKLEHPHILPIYNYGQEGEYLYLVVRLMDGGSLDQRLSGKPLPLSDIDRLMGQIASGLDYAHQHNIVHRDLKPNNVLLDKFGNAYLMDFGIAKILEGSTQLTATSALMGTPAYMAPEQWKMEPIDHRADLYSLGVILYEMITGETPFSAATPHQMMYAHIHVETPRASELVPGLLPMIDEVIRKATAKNPSDRYPTADEFAKALKQAIQNQKYDARGDLTPIHLRPLMATEIAPTTQLPDSEVKTHPPAATPNAYRLTNSQTIAPVTRTNRGMMTLAAVVVLLVIGGLVAAILLFGRSDKDDNQSAVVQVTETASPSETETVTATSTEVHSPTATETASETVTTTATSAPSETNTVTDTATIQPTETVDGGVLTLEVQQTIETLIALSFTQTATRFTPTPSATPTASFSTSPSQTFTFTPTLTWTVTPTFTMPPTRFVTNTPFFLPKPTATSAQLCPGNPPSIVAVGIQARTTYTDGTATRLRDQPNGTIIFEMPEGYGVEVVGGPFCDSNYTWWQLRLPNGRIGWTAEGESGRYFIEPLPGMVIPEVRVLQSNANNSFPEVRTQPSQSGSIIMGLLPGDRVAWNGQLIAQEGNTWAIVTTYDSELGYLLYRPDLLTELNPRTTTFGIAIGETVEVLAAGNLANFRASADTNGSMLRALQQGTTMLVVGGPVFADYFMWWQYRLNDGSTGWVVDVPGWFEVIN